MRTPAVHALLWARCVPSERGDRGPPATPVRHDWQTAQPIGSSVVTVPAESNLKLKAQRAASNVTPTHALLCPFAVCACVCLCACVRMSHYSSASCHPPRFLSLFLLLSASFSICLLLYVILLC